MKMDFTFLITDYGDFAQKIVNMIYKEKVGNFEMSKHLKLYFTSQKTPWGQCYKENLLLAWEFPI